jgi:hypothetical protein
MNFMRLESILRKDNTLRQRQRRHKRTPGLPGKRLSRSGKKAKMHAMH